jgi:type VI secretion system protein
VLVEARARAKSQMGAELTGLQLEGNNPIKFARSPEQALARLLSPAEPGFMESDRAVEDAYLDLQSHQVATLRAIPGALRATLDRFSPGAIRRRAEQGGILSRILPALQDAALWRNYEREYVRVKNESDEAFMEVFSKEFRKAYERQLREGFEDKSR